jgi:diaminopimelate decarboxylase
MILTNNQYQIQNLPVLDIVQQHGSPLYVYDADKIVEKINELKSAFSTVNLKIKFACKALTNISILKLMRSQGIEAIGWLRRRTDYVHSQWSVV